MTRDQLKTQLSEPYALPADAIAKYREFGYVKLKEVLSPEVLAFYGEQITHMVKVLNDQSKPMAERTTYEKAFLQIMNIWTKDETVREFAFSSRLARIAAELMGVKGVRMYHDQALYKEPSGGFTPWHADQFYWPLSNSNSVTVWIPFQNTTIDMGPLAFSVGSQQFETGRDLAISDDSEEKMRFNLRNYPIDEGPYALGEISYHSGWTFHRAGPNTSATPRAVMTMIYFEDGMRLIAPKHKNHQSDWDSWLSGTQIGEVIQTPLNPVLYSAS
jgi:ectoine hydroxylase-related dioxygenase (phytanoyl-CoA dioxygenase family)